MAQLTNNINLLNKVSIQRCSSHSHSGSSNEAVKRATCYRTVQLDRGDSGRCGRCGQWMEVAAGAATINHHIEDRVGALRGACKGEGQRGSLPGWLTTWCGWQTAAKLCGFIVDRMNAFKQTIAACGAGNRQSIGNRNSNSSNANTAAAAAAGMRLQQEIGSRAAPTAPLPLLLAVVAPRCCCCYTFS